MQAEAEQNHNGVSYDESETTTKPYEGPITELSGYRVAAAHDVTDVRLAVEHSA